VRIEPHIADVGLKGSLFATDLRYCLQPNLGGKVRGKMALRGLGCAVVLGGNLSIAGTWRSVGAAAVYPLGGPI
jgi:hypothetical protein